MKIATIIATTLLHLAASSSAAPVVSEAEALQVASSSRLRTVVVLEPTNIASVVASYANPPVVHTTVVVPGDERRYPISVVSLSATYQSDDPTATGTGEPMFTTVVDEPMFTTVADEPMFTTVADEPMFTTVADEPMFTTVNDEPTPSSAV